MLQYAFDFGKQIITTEKYESFKHLIEHNKNMTRYF